MLHSIRSTNPDRYTSRLEVPAQSSCRQIPYCRKLFSMSRPIRNTYCMVMCCLAAGFVASGHARVLQQTKDFDLILGVSPDASKEYGGRHITIAHVTAKSEAAAADVLRKCKHVLAEWSMRGSTSLGSMAGPACLGHMSPGATTCSDNKEWQIDGYGSTPTISIASKTLDAYADCLKGKSFEPKGPIHDKNKTVWHSALYKTSDAHTEFKAFVNNKEKWVPYINHRHSACAATPKGKPSCWQWTKL